MSKSFRLSIGFVILLTGYIPSVHGQDTSNTIGRVSIASPTAASLGKYGDIPVSYHTGIPQIGIPVYTVQSGSLKLPIGLSYHSSGLKVHEPAGWVGAGWSLNAGGAITRTVMGSPDDRGYSTSNVLNGHYTDYGFNNYLNNGGAGYGGTPDDLLFARGTKDGEPDLYFFNFGGYSGKFYFNDDRTPIIIPEQDFRIQTFIQTGQGFTGFIVTTPDGTRYFFGQVGNNSPVSPIEATNPFTVQNGPSNTTAAASSWFLNKILSADGMDSITLSYNAENYSYYTISTFPVINTHYNQISGDYTMQNGMNVVKNLVAGVRLSQISFANGTVSFMPAASPRTDLSSSAGLLVSNSMTDNANTSSYALGSITIADNNGFCKKDTFYFGYFYDGSALPTTFFQSYSSYNLHSDQYRLRLDSVQETSCDGTATVPPYKFSYFSEKVPRMLSFGVDHWGYANGADTNSTMVPTFTVITSGTPQVYGGGNRDALWPAMRGGSLQQIGYPTGGSTQFDFEPKNIYTFTNSTLQNVTLTSLIVHEYGQSTLTQTLPFTLSGTGNCTINVNNTSTNWSPTFTITNSGNTVVYNSGLINVSSTLSTSLSLPAGTYTATLSFPSNSGSTLINGADASIGQWQYVPTTTTVTVGGLRIKTITTNDGLTANNIITSYNYTGGGSQSTGVLYSIPIYVQILRSDINKLVWGDLPTGLYCSPNGCWSCDGFNAHDYYISPGSVQPMNSLQGENMGFNEVDVSQTGNGKSVYRYYGSNLWSLNINDVCQRVLTQSSLCDISIPSFPYPPVPFEFMRDELQYEAHFNQAGQVLTEKYYFPVYAPDPLITPGHISVDLPYISTYTEYNLQSAKKIKDSVSSILYDPSTGNRLVSSSTTYYNSLFHHQPTRKVSSTSTGDSLAVNTKYAFDFRISSCDASVPDSLPYYLGVFHNDSTWLDPAISVCSPQVNNTNNCRLSTFGQYRQMMMRDRLNFMHYRRRSYAPDSSNLLSSCYLGALPTADPLLKPILRLQNMYDNTPLESSEWKNLNLQHASFTQYDTSLNPVGFAYPGRTQLINLQAPSATFTNAVVSGSTVSKDSRYADETFYTFSKGNPQQVTGRDGVPSSYIWDYMNTKPIAKVINATVDQVAYTSFEADGSGSWTIGSGTRDTVYAITGKRSYNLAGGACSRSGLTSTNTYIVSYWTKTGSSFSVTGSTATKQGKTIGPWTYFEHTVTSTSSVSVSGSGDIDELRLYPATAQMTSYTYSPLVGMTSQCDATNRLSYYSYDPLGRLKAIRDQDGNILKQYDYQYQSANKCGSNCYILPLQTSAGTSMLGYPVGVFDVHGKLLGNATGPGQFVGLWNADTADSRIGTLAVSADSLHFNLTLNTGMTLLAGVTGMRYYQVDLAWNQIDGIRSINATYVDFGDGTGMRLGNTYTDTPSVIAPNTTYVNIQDGTSPINRSIYFIHNYPDTTLKTITFYHNDADQHAHLDNANSPAKSLIRLKNFRGNVPQNTQRLGGSCYQVASMTSLSGITNWNQIRSVLIFNLNKGDGINSATNISYPQDFMQNNKGLQTIYTSRGYRYSGYIDTTCKLSRLKSDWNTYFTNLQSLIISDDHWNHEDLSALKQLNFVEIIATTQNHKDDVNSPLVPIPSATIDAILNQVAAGAGQSVNNGIILLYTAGSARTSSSDAAVTSLTAKGWTITIQ